MPKYCPQCGKENADDAFWCVHCNTKLLTDDNINRVGKPFSGSKKHTPTISLEENRSTRLAVKAFFVTCLIIIPCILAGIFLTQGGISFFSSGSFAGVNCHINEDFWFEGNYLNTSEGWSFELTKVKDYRLEGRILATNTYTQYDTPYDPCNIFSPIDLVIGIGDIQTNPDKYDYSITSFSHRTMSWYLYYEDISDYYYFQSHTGNNHIIPHNAEVLDVLAHNISVGDSIILEGSLVDLYGTKADQYWTWTTDTHIGNYKCEIILVDTITITD